LQPFCESPHKLEREAERVRSSLFPSLGAGQFYSSLARGLLQT
jgi:hypothetical protein